MTPSAMTTARFLTADVRHAFALDDPGPWNICWVQTRLQGRDVKVLGALDESPAIRTRAMTDKRVNLGEV
jgi:hypothetical protein